ncbi:MAG: DDE-type integrase/transposase/recombinase [Candidatus Diapherotrites archaeon]
MTKLSNKRIKFIVKAVCTGKANIEQLAKLYEVSVRRVQQIMKEYNESGEIPVLKKNRRPKESLSLEEKEVIDKAYEKVRLCACRIKPFIKKKFKMNISHNKIHEHLKQKGLAKSDKKKQKQRRYCRYERKHSLSLIHLDWHEPKENKKIKVLPIIDDASRKIIAIGEFTAINTHNALKVLEDAIQHAFEYNAFIKELNSDRDTTFMTNKPRKTKHDNHKFQKALRKHNIKFIPSRRRHPQTNGKNERWFQEYDKHRFRFNTVNEFIEWYNNRPHGSLDRENAETPNEAFIRKLQPECLLGMFYKNIIEAKK